MNPKIIGNSWRVSKILPIEWSTNFAMDEHEKLRMNDTSNQLASLISSLNLGSEYMPIKEYMQLVGEEIVDAEHIMNELVDLDDEPMDGNDVDD